jgi:hypothetical protein
MFWFFSFGTENCYSRISVENSVLFECYAVSDDGVAVFQKIVPSHSRSTRASSLFHLELLDPEDERAQNGCNYRPVNNGITVLRTSQVSELCSNCQCMTPP